MEKKIINIEIPEGYEIDKQKSTFEKIVFKETVKKLPTSWEELNKITGYFIDKNSRLGYANNCETKYENKNVFPTKELAEAALALAQLLQLREKYNDGWMPNWNDNKVKFSIYRQFGKLDKVDCRSVFHVLTFKTEELRDEFFKNFKDLLEVAKPLL